MKNFKKVISVVMALAMIISSFTAVSAAKFADVADTAAYTEAVEVLAALGVVNGVAQENGTFNFEPEKSVTRAEAATMIVGALNLADDAKAAAGTSRFDDVNSQAAWAAGFVNVGVAQGFINGYDATTFGPLDNVTYAQLCVMLTQITGYGDYAKAYGGWPTGYTTMAASTGINKGVAVASDEALTKGQVAMMIWNALQTPLLGVHEYAINGNVYKPQNGKDDTEYKTLFTEKFEGFTAKITIDNTPVLSGADERVADITVVESDFWMPTEKAYPQAANSNNSAPLNADGTLDVSNIEFIESVDVNSNFLHTGKAVFVMNDDDEPVMVYFKATQKAASKELAADTYYLQEDLVDAKQFSSAFPKIRFGSTYYEFENNINIYVNGVKHEPVAGQATIVAGNDTPGATLSTEQGLLDHILGSAQGTVKILKSGSVDNYNVIFVDYYQIAEVAGVDLDDEETVIELQNIANTLDTSSANLEKIVVTKEALDEGKTTVKVTKNGEDATLESLANGDIIAYAAAFTGHAISNTGRAIEDPREIKIIATNDKISGSVTAIDDNATASPVVADDVYTIGGVDYERVPGATWLPTINVKSSLDVTLDPFGRIYSAKLNADTKNYAIVLKRAADNETVKLLLADGTTKSYKINSKFESDFVTNFATGANDVNLSTLTVDQRVVEFEVSGKDGTLTSLIKLLPTDSGVTTLTNDEYRGRTSILGGNKIVDSTPIINLIDRTQSAANEGNYAVLTKDELLDGTMYDGYVYSLNRTVGFVVITNIGTAFAETSRFAIAIDTAKEVLTEDGDKVKSVKVLYNGEVQELLFAITSGVSAADTLAVNTPFFFETDADGYVDAVFTAPFAGNTAWDAKIETRDWSYDLWNPGRTPIQIVSGVVTEVTSNSISFAPRSVVAGGNLDITFDLEKTWNLTDDTTTTDVDESLNAMKGIVSFGIADDCAAYTYEINMQTRREEEKYDVTSATSIKASNFSTYDYGNGIPDDGVYAENTDQAANDKMIDRATEATAMVVDGEIVAIFAIEK